MPGWTDILGSFVTGLPQLAQAGASIYAASRQPRTVMSIAPAVSPVGYSPYIPTANLMPMQTAQVPAMVGGGGLARIGQGALGMARQAARAVSARIAAYVGRRVSPQQAMALVRRVGPEAAAAALGISTVELAQWLMQSGSLRARRRRGITGRQIANARSTIRRMTGFMARVQEACSPAMRGRSRRRGHRSGCACVACRAA